MTDDESKRVVFNFAKKKLTLEARGAETGRSKVEMPLEYDGKPIEISFDPKFVIEMLRVLEPATPICCWKWWTATARPCSAASAIISYLVMPLV